MLAIVDDLFFRAKLETAAAHLGASLSVAPDAGAALGAGPAWGRILIDLNLGQGDPVAMVRQLREAHPGVPIIGYYAHVQQELRRQALEAGCTEVLPRSAFVQQFQALLA